MQVTFKNPTDYWFFRPPKEIKLDEAFKLAPIEIDWPVIQYSNKIKAGDKVYFWGPGEIGGIIGYGKVLTKPELSPIGSEIIKISDYYVKVLVKSALKNPIPRV